MSFTRRLSNSILRRCKSILSFQLLTFTVCCFRLGDGRLLKKGAEKLQKNYWLSVKQYHQLSPPTLDDTKLHFLNDQEVGGLSERFLAIHR